MSDAYPNYRTPDSGPCSVRRREALETTGAAHHERLQAICDRLTIQNKLNLEIYRCLGGTSQIPDWIIRMIEANAAELWRTNLEKG